ncbi:MAG: formate dehydrogenase subunit gamma [Rhodocyclaceae bacterium]|nr:formate dehydrogenase subunit gamma [Rhodocyclaceae bacterium]
MDITRIEAIIGAHRERPGALLPILHSIQDELGYVPEEAIPVIARELDLSRAEVHGVVGFYHHFRHQPPGRHVFQVCRAEACQARGADRLLAHIEASLGCTVNETTGDGAYTLEPVYCLGQCACGPALTFDGRLHARMTPDRFDALAAREDLS